MKQEQKTLYEYVVEPGGRKVLGVRHSMEPLYSAILGLLEDGEALTRADIKIMHIAFGGSSKTMDKDVIDAESLSTRINRPIMERYFGRNVVYSYPDKENSTSVLRALVSISNTKGSP